MHRRLRHGWQILQEVDTTAATQHVIAHMPRLTSCLAVLRILKYPVGIQIQTPFILIDAFVFYPDPAEQDLGFVI
jgi:hypothetical protein